MAETDLFRSHEQDSVYLARAFAVAALGVPLALIMLFASLGFGALFVAIPISFGWGLAGIGSLICCIRSAMRKAWRRSLLTAILPVTLLLVALNPLGFLYSCMYLGEIVRFSALKYSYDRIIADLPANERPGLVVFIWDGFLGASNGVLYDATDQVTLPPGHQSADWLARASHTELGAATQEREHCGYSVQPLWAHYYRASFWC